MTAPENIDAYIAQFQPATAAKLDEMRAAIRRAAPEATETISYAMPAYKLAGMLVWFAAHKRHIGFYPRGSGIEEFADELASYRTSKGAVQFPLDEPLPIDLIERIVRFRVGQNQQRGRNK